MKKIIILFLISNHLQCYCQTTTLSVECSDSVLMSIKGKYQKEADVINISSSILTKAQQPEVFRRLDAIHKLLLEAYPQPTGFEAYWWKVINSGLFAPDVNYEKGIPICNFQYVCAFNSYGCVQNYPKEVICCEPGMSSFHVFANQLGLLQSEYHLDTMTIKSQKVYMLNPLIGSWKGYDLYGTLELSNRSILITRSGEKPFVPVTRKQYLEYCFNYLNKTFDESIKSLDMVPVRTLETQETLKKKALDKIDNDYKNNPKNRDFVRKNFLDAYKTDQQRRDESAKKIIENKTAVINRYKAEFEKTKADNLLESPAEVYAPFTVSENTPIFASGPKGGQMLVMANPAYIKKNLPKYVPQFIVMHWHWTGNFPKYGGAQSEDFRKQIEDNFPIKKLQGMIDK